MCDKDKASCNEQLDTFNDVPMLVSQLLEKNSKLLENIAKLIQLIQEAQKPDKVVADINQKQCKKCNIRKLYRKKQDMQNPYIYECNIKSVDSAGMETKCIKRTLRNWNFRMHLKNKHGILVDNIKVLEKWRQLKIGLPEINDSQKCGKCHDCKRKKVDNLSKNGVR